MRKILVGYDGSEWSRKALETGCEIAEKFGCELIVLTVIPKYERMVFYMEMVIPGDAEERAQNEIRSIVEKLRKRGINAKGLVRSGDVVDEILRAGEDCDLIVLGHRGLGKFEKFLLGSVSERVARFSSKSVLIVR